MIVVAAVVGAGCRSAAALVALFLYRTSLHGVAAERRGTQILHGPRRVAVPSEYVRYCAESDGLPQHQK